MRVPLEDLRRSAAAFVGQYKIPPAVHGAPLQALLRDLDPLWRAMAAVRAGLLDQINAGARIVAERPLDDFYTLASQLYRGYADDAHCAVCAALVPVHAQACPFCRTVYGQARTVHVAAPADDEAPAEPRAVPALDAYPEPPVAIGAPAVKDPRLRHDRGTTPRRRHETSRRGSPKSTNDMVKYMRRFVLSKHFPFSPEQLARRSITDLRTIARLCPEWSEDVSRMCERDLRRWIAGNQPTAAIDPGPPPRGTMPDLSDLEERHG